MKYIVVTGSVMSGIGKGITASSIGVLLKICGLSVTAIKIDPYLNVDSGTMSPFEHGECYVLDDGGETDLDLGNYERFLNITLTSDHNITGGKVYQKLIEKERRGDYLGKTVQIGTHFVQLVKEWIERVAKIDVDFGEPDVCIIELGGTIGDIESAPFVEAIRQMITKDWLVVNVTALIDNGELKTKPAQQGIKLLRSVGLIPDILVVRSQDKISDEIKSKLGNFCQLSTDKIITSSNVENIYKVPIIFSEQGLIQLLREQLNLNRHFNNILWTEWLSYYENYYVSGRLTKKIAIVGKYTKGVDCYLSLTNAIKHACMSNKVNHDIHFLDSEVERDYSILTEYDAVIIPGGFGQRGIEGMISAAQVCRENDIPLLGICLGFQVMIIEYARNVMGLKGANSTEFDPDTPHPVITIIENNKNLGGTMRLGLQTTIGDTIKIYKRHRHRYEFNPEYLFRFMKAGVKFIGWDETETKIDRIKIGKSVGVQYHPEYTSRPLLPERDFTNLLRRYYSPPDAIWSNGKETNSDDKLKIGYLWGALKDMYPNMELLSILDKEIYVDGRKINNLLEEYCI